MTWKIEEFFDAWLPGSDHVYIWRHVREALEYSWQRTLNDIDYCSLPRGRVSQMRLASGAPVTFAIYHGNDSPLGEPGLARVRKCFQLPAACRAAFDEHERCIAGQPEALSHALGHDLEVRGVEASELDWGEE